MSPLTVKQWRTLVFASTHRDMTAAVKVLCLYLADNMSADRKVSVARVDIAAGLGVHQQRVAERLRRAVDAGYLTNTKPGYTGRTAEYQGLRPDSLADCVRQSGTQSEPESGRLCTDLRDTLDTPRAVHSPEAKPTDTGGLCTALQDASIEEPSRAGTDLSDPAPESAPDEPSSTDRVEKQIRSNEKSPTDQVSVSAHVCPWHGEEFPCADDCSDPLPMPDRKERA